jgi:chromosome partitioning protein
MSKIIAVLNQKGGVGKTTTVVNLGAYLAKLTKNILIVDLDPQGNTTSGLGLDKNSLQGSVYDVLIGSKTIEQSIYGNGQKGIYVLPANESLAGAEIELNGTELREKTLKSRLANDKHDIVLIDCPPSLGLLSINALIAADYVLIPVQTEFYALEGLGQLMHTIQRVQKVANPNLKILGILMTMYDSRTSLSEQVKGELVKYFGPKLFQTVIPRNVKLAEAPSFGIPISEHDKWSKGARAYKSLAKEVYDRVK